MSSRTLIAIVLLVGACRKPPPPASEHAGQEPAAQATPAPTQSPSPVSHGEAPIVQREEAAAWKQRHDEHDDPETKKPDAVPADRFARRHHPDAAGHEQTAEREVAKRPKLCRTQDP